MVYFKYTDFSFMIYDNLLECLIIANLKLIKECRNKIQPKINFIYLFSYLKVL